VKPDPKSYKSLFESGAGGLGIVSPKRRILLTFGEVTQSEIVSRAMAALIEKRDNQIPNDDQHGGNEATGSKNVTDTSLDSLQIDENRCQIMPKEIAPVMAATY
jgi:hypothetical protein